MDVLVHHCIRELSFDGGLGCNVSRLRDFITAFYNGYDGPQQVVDDALCAFVWSVIVLRPEVCVGVIPPGITSEVYIAPQTSAKRKAAAKGEQLFEDGPPVLQVIEDARTKTLQELKSQYGEDLRIAVDPQTSFAAITGSHIRPAKLSPMVYSALQLITRGREEGITTVELGRKTKYDQKTCFYVIKQLIELGLVIKVRRAGVANYTCIHKYFVERSPLWQQIQQEEANDSDIAVTGPHVQMSDPVDKATVPNETPEITFDPIDGKHLSSLQLVKNRIVRLLKASINHMHALNNLLVAIGFNNPTKTDRRFFRTRLRELIQQGTIERVSVPHSTVGGRMVKCIRLVEPHSQLPKGGRVIDAHDVDEDEKDALYDVSGGYTDVKSNMTIHKQVSNLLEEAGPSGLTLQEICSALGNFDKRTIELLLTRAAKNPLPSHLRDLATIDVMETHGRERRHRYFTLAAYKMAMTAENLQGADAAHGEVDLSRVGEFAEFDAKVFYTNSANLFDHLQPAKVKISVDKKRKRSMERASGDEIDGPPLTRRGRPRKHPVADDSQPPRKRGRPRKYPLSVEGGEDRTPKKRGRPPKKRNHDTATTSDGLQGVLSPSGAGTVPLQDAAPSDMRMQEPGRSEDVTEEIGKPGFVNDRPSREVGDTDLVAERPHIPVTEAQPTSCGHDGELLAEGVSQTHPATGSRLVEGTLHDASLNEGDAAINTELPAAGSSVTEPLAPYTLELLPSKDGGQTSGKRSLSLNSLTSGSTKRPKTAGLGDKARSSINISALRRENELFRVIEELGGITNLHTKEIYEAHTALLDTMNKEGEPTSAPPGTRLDKRTAEATLKSLENRGRIKMLKTSIMSGSGASKPACLLYLPDTPQESINEYLRRLSQNMPLASTPSPVKTVGHVEFGVGRRVSQRLPCPGGASEKEPQISDVDPAEQIPIHDSQTLESVPPCERRRKRSKRKKSAQANIEARAALRKKAEEAKHQREQDWVQLLDRVHPEPVKGTLAMHIRILRARFMQSTSIKDLNLWEEEIRKTIRDTELAAKKILSRPRRLQTSYRKPTGPPPMVANPPEKSVASLVAQQGSHVAQHTKSKSKGKEKDKEDSDGKLWQRRSRFQWTREFDELARDASAIIRARCRDIGRLDLSAFDQVFPSVPRNSVRQRIVHLRESAGEDLYMKRLEDQWYTMWVQHRGTIHLPDDDPESPSNFDLVKHLEFLRKHVDKNALRVGFVEREAVVRLPTTVEELPDFFEMGKCAGPTPPWDFLWNSLVEEGREKQFLSHAFTKGSESVVVETSDGNIATAEAALKMVFGTPNELYDPDSGAKLLHSVGTKPVSIAISNLLSQGVLSKLVRDPKKPKPGRTLKIAELNLNAIGGPFSRELFQDANALEDIAVEGDVEEMEWTTDAHDGDVVTLMQLVSEDQVSFHVDTSYPQSVRPRIDWNSKRADDDDIETTIHVKFSASPPAESAVADPFSVETPLCESEATGTGADEYLDHGRTSDGSTAACALETSHGVISCVSCVAASFSKFVAGLNESDLGVAEYVLKCIRASGSSGMTKAMLLQYDAEPERVLDLVQRMASLVPPVLVWTGYVIPVVVASEHTASWTVVVSEEPTTLVLPRRWLDVRGLKLDEFWTAALRAIVSTVVLHPGIPQAELRWRLKAVYDRQEFLEAVTFLEQDGMLEARVNDSEALLKRIKMIQGWAATLDDEEEKRVYWFIGNSKRWYRV